MRGRSRRQSRRRQRSARKQLIISDLVPDIFRTPLATLPLLYVLGKSHLDKQKTQFETRKREQEEHYVRTVIFENLRKVFPRDALGDRFGHCFIRGTTVFEDEGKVLFNLLKEKIPPSMNPLQPNKPGLFIDGLEATNEALYREMKGSLSPEPMRVDGENQVDRSEGLFFAKVDGFHSTCSRKGENSHTDTEATPFLFVRTKVVDPAEAMVDEEKVDRFAEEKGKRYTSVTFLSYSITENDGTKRLQIREPTRRVHAFVDKSLDGKLFSKAKELERIYRFNEEKASPVDPTGAGSVFMALQRLRPENAEWKENRVFDDLNYVSKATKIPRFGQIQRFRDRSLSLLRDRILLRRRGDEYFVPQAETNRVVARITVDDAKFQEEKKKNLL